MKKSLYSLSIVILSILLFSCIFDNTNNLKKTDSSSSNNNEKIPSQYWGTWIQMDTGAEYYIDNQNIYIISSNTKSTIQNGISGYSLESEEVLRKENIVFFRKGGKNRSFSVNISGFSSPNIQSSRAPATSISGKRQNKNNSEDNETVSSDDGDLVIFKGGVADDPQTITIIQGLDIGSATVEPQFDGENVGSIPVVEPGKYAFKTTYKVSNTDSQGFMYGNNLGVYNISFYLTNIGQETCATSVYSISWNDTNLSSIELEKEGNFTSIAPGSAKVITGSFIYGYFDEEYKDVTITISITDSKYEKTWYDYVTLRFYRGWVNYRVNARNFNQSSNATLNGFLVYPDGRSKRFTVASEKTTTVSVPWSTKDYYFVLSGANNDTEMCYSFVASEYGSPSDLSGVWSISEINAYEPNDSMQNAITITDYKSSTKAYLKNGDIDYYTFNVSTLKCSKGIMGYSGHKFSDSTSISSSLNNKDGNINPGEIIWMDVEVHNSSARKMEDLIVEVSSSSSYITFTSNSAFYGNISTGYYQSYNGYKYSYSNTGWQVSNYDYYDVTSESYVPFKFKIADECPIGTTIPINIKMTDKNGYEWTDSFNITVLKSGTDMEYSGHKFSDSTSISNVLNNGDGKINPGEIIWMDVKIHNKGTSQGKKIVLEATSESEYITFSASSANYGDITAGYYQSYYGSIYSYENTGWSSSSDDHYLLWAESSVPFKFSISSECPVGTVIPINLKMTDKNGYEWTDSFSITVVKEDVDIEFASYELSYYDGSVMREGDTRSISIIIYNKGTSTAKNVQVIISSDYPHFVFMNDTVNYGNISAKSTKSCSFTFQATADYPRLNVIPIQITITDANGNEWIETFTITG